MRAIVLALLLAGCMPFSAVRTHAPLPAVVQHIPDGEVYAKCARAWPLWQHIMFFPILPLGCAERLPAHGVCLIWVGETSTDGTIKHERRHCAGYDH